MNDKGNYNNICLNHHLIKSSQILAIEKLIPKELYSLYLLFWKMNFLLPKNIFATFSLIYKLNGKRFISYHVKFQLTPIYICSNRKYWIIFSILIKSFSFLTLSWGSPLWYRNQSIELRSKYYIRFLYDNGLRHERVKKKDTKLCSYCRLQDETINNILLNVNLLSNYGMIWDIIVNVALIFQFQIHRVPLLDSLKLILI